jgi:autotransporter-associated beta strand protein
LDYVPGGFGGGRGGFSGGGGGLGAGGDIFVQQGATLTIAGGSTLGAGTVAGGKGALDGLPGVGLGDGIFLQGNQSLTLAPAAGQTVTIGGRIADLNASGGGGVGAIIMNGAGVLTLSAGNTFTGGVTIEQGTLELAAAGAGGTGNLSFSGPGGALRVDLGIAVTNTITGFAAGDTIDLAGFVATSDQFANGKLTVHSGDSAVASLSIAGSFAAERFALAADGAGGTDITLVANIPPTVTAPAAESVATSTTTGIAGVSIADADAVAAGKTLSVTISDSVGKLTVSTTQGSVRGGDSRYLTLAGTLAQVNADLATLSYIASSRAGSDTIKISADDGNGGLGSAAIAITVAAPSPSIALFTQAIAAFGAESSAILDRREALAATPFHLHLTAAP